MALDRPYTTATEVRRELRNNDTFEDDWIEEMINLASRWVDDFCNKEFWFYDHSVTALTVLEDDIYNDRIFLPWPIITLTAVYSDDDLIDSDGYRWNNGRLEQGSAELIRNGECSWLYHYNSPHRTILGMSTAPPIITLVGTFGYTYVDDDTPPSNIPAAVRRATTLIAASMSGLYKREFIGQDGVKQDVTDNRIPMQAKKMLQKWKWHIDI